MALQNISKFNWDKLLSKLNGVDEKRVVNLLRAKANDISSNATKYVKDPEAIDFGSYKNKLKFTSSAVADLENAYKARKLPVYTASLPEFDKQKRASMQATVQTILDAAKADLVDLEKQVESLEQTRISATTSVGELNQRFPHFAREVEQEINAHNWTK